MTASSSTAAAQPTQERPGPVDWLDYQQYAQALWSRVRRGFELEGERAARQHDGTAPPAGDPLVIGIYGEWGVGKSRLLELVYVLAAAASARECARRALDPNAYAHSPALRLTVPVWFHPWKYEHEQHLAVPLLMHLAEAVGTTLKDANSLVERTRSQLQEMGKTAADAAHVIEKSASWIKAAARVAHQVAGHNLVKTATSVAAGFVGLGPAAEKTLEWVHETGKQLAGEDEKNDKKADKKIDKSADAAGAKKEKTYASPGYSADGRYYYNLQAYLRELARIQPSPENGLQCELQLNFAVFIDDLDRCLPEKAVEVLEVIKTVLNTENFAFLVALDDEVIERGISHRYRDYRFEGAKPQMPITGFEYLEKIVHLPFRLPQLTREQAHSFVMEREKQLLAPGVPRLWFTELEDDTGKTTALVATPLLHILLDSFDAYVPRKLARTMELMSQYQQVLGERGLTLQSPRLATANPAVDTRLILFCVLMQLFAPEIFRLLRRRPGIFGQWMRANLVENATMMPAFEWELRHENRPLVIDVSDSDLFRWAALGSRAARSVQTSTTAAESSYASPNKVPSIGEAKEWANYIAANNQSDRHTIEQLRLPFVQALIDFRATQRHAFSPLRLGAAMAAEMNWTYGDTFDLQPYMQMLSSFEATVVPQPAVGAPVPPATPDTPPAAPGTAQPPRRALNTRVLLDLALSSDAGTRASLVERLGLRNGESIDAAAVGDIAVALSGEASGREARFLNAIAALAPFLEISDLKAHRDAWDRLPPWSPPVDSPHAPPDGTPPTGDLLADMVVEKAQPYARLREAGLVPALNLQDSIEQIKAEVLRLLGEQIGSQQRTRLKALGYQLGIPVEDMPP